MHSSLVSNSKRRSTALCCLILLAMCLIGFRMLYHPSNVSTNVAQLQKLVDLGMAPTSGKWEIFSTPEYTGGVPGPTDYTTLIAELTSIDETAFLANPQAEKVWIAPESARPWLSENFRQMLDEQKNLDIDLSKNPHCRMLHATLNEASEIIKGFICKDTGRALIYLRIADYSKP